MNREPVIEVKVEFDLFTTEEEIDTLITAIQAMKKEDLKNVDLEALRGLC